MIEREVLNPSSPWPWLVFLGAPALMCGLAFCSTAHREVAIQAATDRLPLVEVSGRPEQLPVGDGINIGTGGFTGQMLKMYPWAEPANITGTVNDWNDPACPLGVCGDGSVVRDYSFVVIHTTDATGATLTGMVVPSITGPSGTQKRLCNYEVGSLTIPSQSGSSQFNNQFRFLNVSQIVIPPWHCKDFFTLGQQWRLASETPNSFYDAGVTTIIGPITMADSAFATAAQLSNGPYFLISPQGTGQTSPPPADFQVTDARTYDTTAAGIQVNGVASSVTGTRSAGANNLTNVAGFFAASGGQVNYSLQTGAGNEYHGLGTQHAFDLFNSLDVDAGGQLDAEGTTTGLKPALTIGGNLVNGTTKQQIFSVATPTASVGTLDGDSTNWAGRITSIGANTSVTLTFGGSGFGTTARCWPSPETNQFIYVSTASKTAPIFSCLTAPGGSAANCGNFSYWCEGH